MSTQESKEAPAAVKVPQKVTLTSQEGEQFEIDGAVARMSELVKTMIGGDDDGDDKDSDDSDNDEQEIPLPNVKSEVLGKVIEFCKHHIEKPLKSSKMEDVELLFELILAANYMDIKSLLDLTCAKVASMIKGKTPEEIRKTFNIVNDFTPEEEAKVREENKWCEEA
eukprot:GSMAST32.ASY1.ANO1.1254.1 assembled CDS